MLRRFRIFPRSLVRSFLRLASPPESEAIGDESRRGAAAAPHRRPYGNAARTSRSGRNQGDSNALALDNPEDFPTLPKQ